MVVEYDNVGLVRAHSIQKLRAVGGLIHHADFRVALKKMAQPYADQILRVGQDDLNRFCLHLFGFILNNKNTVLSGNTKCPSV